MSQREFVSVFRSSRKADTYLFVRKGQPWEDLPEPLREHFGTPVPALELLLTPERKLARTTGARVLEAIRDQGFYLQLPEEPESYIVEFKRRLEQNRR